MSDKMLIDREVVESAVRMMGVLLNWVGGPTNESVATLDALRAALAAQDAEPVAWRDHVEQRIRTWRQRTMDRSGDRLAIDDFMGESDIDDLVDFVCDEWVEPAAKGA